MRQKFVSCLNPKGFHRLSYFEWGRADAPRTIVCVHGLTRNAHDFDKLAAALQDKARMICVDVVGRGASDRLPNPADYATPQYLADMTVLLARLDCEMVDWIGTSMGGLLGMLLAAQPGTPIRKLVINDIGPLLPAAAAERIAAYACNPPVFEDETAALDYMRRIYGHAGPCTDADYIDMTRHGIAPRAEGGYTLTYDPAIAVNFAMIKQDIDIWPVYDRIACPALVLHGEISDVLAADTAAEMTRRGPRARLVTIPGIGHYPALMDAAQIARVEDFLFGGA